MSLLREVGYPEPSDPKVSRRMQANRRRDTRPERALRSALHARGLRFRKDLPIRAGERLVRPDVVFTRARVAVFVDGCYWHVCPEHGTSPRRNSTYWSRKLRLNVDRDRAVDAALAQAGWRVIRIWEHEEPTEVAERVEFALQNGVVNEALIVLAGWAGQPKR
jgi:DNA mismatch endonuclease (patch repair protein)